MIELIRGDCLEEVGKMPDGSIDLTVTSPPYDDLRAYNGTIASWTPEKRVALIAELYRVTKDGGVVAWVVQDQTKNFRKSGTSFRSALDFLDAGFGLFETVIYKKYGAEGAWWNKRFRVDHEYVFFFFKGERPRFFNKEHLKIPSKHAGKTMTGGATRKRDGTTCKSSRMVINPTKCRGTVWEYLNGGDKNKLKRQHPATFPDQLAKDIIQTFTTKGDMVLDPLMGSGTTGVACKNFNRNFIGIELERSYYEIAKKRIDDAV